MADKEPIIKGPPPRVPPTSWSSHEVVVQDLAPTLPKHGLYTVEGEIEQYGALAEGLRGHNRTGHRRWLLPIAGVLVIAAIGVPALTYLWSLIQDFVH